MLSKIYLELTTLPRQKGHKTNLNIIAADIDMVSPEMKISGRDGSDPPLSLAGEGVPLVVAGGASDDLVTVLVH